jgi:hypothetical protein
MNTTLVLNVMWWLTAGTPSSLCAAAEHAYFSCSTAKGKMIALCGSAPGAATPWLQYRFGKVGAVELTFPTKKEGSLGAFLWERHVHVNSMSYTVRFTNSGFTYEVFDQNTMGSATDHGAGVLVDRPTDGGNAKTVSLLCREDVEPTLDVEALSQVLAHGPDDQPEPK